MPLIQGPNCVAYHQPPSSAVLRMSEYLHSPTRLQEIILLLLQNGRIRVAIIRTAIYMGYKRNSKRTINKAFHNNVYFCCYELFLTGNWELKLSLHYNHHHYLIIIIIIIIMLFCYHERTFAFSDLRTNRDQTSCDAK
jgi:hypothetical protein